MKFISKLFVTAMVALMAASGVAQAQDMKFFVSVQEEQAVPTTRSVV